MPRRQASLVRGIGAAVVLGVVGYALPISDKATDASES